MRKKLVCGIGINDADYVVQVRKTVSYVDGKQKQKLIWICPFYRVWTDMLKRGYSKKYKEKYPTYKDVFVNEEWHSFSNFRAWMEKQPWIGTELDKDILCKENKEYNSNKCAFIPKKINYLLLDHNAAKGEQPLGVYYNGKYTKSYISQTSGYAINGKVQRYIGMFSTPKEAHKAWQLAKADVIDEAVMWWQFDSSVNHSFRQDVAEALFVRSEQLRYNAKNNIETLKI